MEEIIKFLEDEGFEFEVGCREKERKKTMSEAMKKLKESNDEKKIELAEKLARHYEIYDLIENLPTKPDLEGILVTAKRGIAGVIKALGNDEELDPFTKYLMFTHMYTPEQVKEIGHEEIYRRKQKFEKDELPDVSYHEDDGTNGKDYEISCFGWEENGRGYITVSEINGNENDIFEEVNIPVPLILSEDWFRKIREYNRENPNLVS